MSSAQIAVSSSGPGPGPPAHPPTSQSRHAARNDQDSTSASSSEEGATPLMYACQQGREQDVRTMLQSRPSLASERDRTGKTALHYCAEQAGPAAAAPLLQAAPQLLDAKDQDGYCALTLAVIAGNRALVRYLLARGADVNALDNEKHSIVHWATVCGEAASLELVLGGGARASTPDLHGGYPLHYAAQLCGPQGADLGLGAVLDRGAGLAVLRALLASGAPVGVHDQDGRQPILWAASAGSADAILALVNAGANVEADDKDGLTALHCAASRGHTDCVETLVALCGADVDVIDSNGCTALFYAVTLGHADCTRVLLAHGAEPNRQDRKGRTGAHCGAAKGQLETLRILAAHGANLWLRNVRGDFPLHDAVQSGRRDLVLWLLQQRPDAVNAPNNDGRCPLHIAALHNNVEMCKVLLDNRALLNPVMRSSRQQLLTPLDAALHRGNRGCAKYLQLHGGVPANRLTEKSASLRGGGHRSTISEPAPERLERSSPEVAMQVARSMGNSPAAGTGGATFLPPATESRTFQVRVNDDVAIRHVEHIDAGVLVCRHVDESSDENQPSKGRRRTKSRSEVQRWREREREDKRRTHARPTSDSGRDSRGAITEDSDSEDSVVSEREKTSRRRTRAARAQSDGERKSARHRKRFIDLDEDEQRGKSDCEEEAKKSSGRRSRKGRHRSEGDDCENPEIVRKKGTDHEKQDSEGRSSSRGRKSSGKSDASKKRVTYKAIGRTSTSELDASEQDSDAPDTRSERNLTKSLSKSHQKTEVSKKEKQRKDDEEVTKREDATREVIKKETVSKVSTKNESTNRLTKEGKSSAKSGRSNKTKIEESSTKMETDSTNVPNSGENMNPSRAEDEPTCTITTTTTTTVTVRTQGTESQDDEDGALVPTTTVITALVHQEEDASSTAVSTTEATPSTSQQTSLQGSQVSLSAAIAEQAVGKAAAAQVSAAPEMAPDGVADQQPIPPRQGEADNNENVAAAEAAASDSGKASSEKSAKSDAETGDTDADSSPRALQSEELTNSVAPAAPSDQVVPKDRQSAVEAMTELNEEETFAQASQAPGPHSRTKARDKSSRDPIKEKIRIKQPDSNKEAKVERIKQTTAPPRGSQRRAESRQTKKQILTKAHDHDVDDGKGDSGSVVNGEVETVIGSGETLCLTREVDLDDDGAGSEPSTGRSQHEHEPDSQLVDSGLEPSPRREKPGGAVSADSSPSRGDTRIPRICRRKRSRPGSAGETDEPENEDGTVSVTRAVQMSMRKYQLERRIFHELLELKRLQIRAGRANEQVLVKRLVDDYRRAGLCVGMTPYSGNYTFRGFEKYLYDQLRSLQSANRRVIPRLQSSDDLEKLTAALRRTRQRHLLNEVPDNPLHCTASTHRCHHAIHAYSGIPCAAYIPRMNHHSMPKDGVTTGFLPHIDTGRNSRAGQVPEIARSLRFVDPSRPVTLELSHGQDKQVISLPTERLDKNKRYYVTFTIKGAPESRGGPEGSEGGEGDGSKDRESAQKHRKESGKSF